MFYFVNYRRLQINVESPWNVLTTSCFSEKCRKWRFSSVFIFSNEVFRIVNIKANKKKTCSSLILFSWFSGSSIAIFRPSGEIPCSLIKLNEYYLTQLFETNRQLVDHLPKQYSSQQALPIWQPAWPTCTLIHSLIFMKFLNCYIES